MKQMLAIYEIGDYDTWKSAFDGDEEARSEAGLGTLQVWREDGASRALALFRVNDAARARDYTATRADLMKERGGVSSAAYHLLDTV